MYPALLESLSPLRSAAAEERKLIRIILFFLVYVCGLFAFKKITLNRNQLGPFPASPLIVIHIATVNH